MSSDRDRLIELLVNFRKPDNPITQMAERMIIERIADYLLANGVIVPPCKVGDKVYLPCLNDWGDIENYTITEFVLDNDGLLFVVDDEDRETHPIEEIGTDVFLTKEEADKKLEERNGK